MAKHMAKSSQYDDNFILAESYYSSVINSKKDQQDKNNILDLHRDSDMSSSVLPSTSDFSYKKPEIAVIDIENANFQNNKRNFPTNHVEMNNADNLRPSSNSSYGVSQFDSKNKKYSTIIEMNGQNIQTNANTVPIFNKPISNRTIYIDPSPSNITRIHINHLDTNNRVNDKIKEVNDRFKSVNQETASSVISPISALTIRDRCNNVMNVNTSNNHMIPPSKPIQFHVINQSNYETDEPVKKVSHGTSPIKVFKSKPTDLEPITDYKFRDASTQMEIDEKTPIIQRKKVTLNTENTNINEPKANQDKTVEEKSKSKSTEQVIEKISNKSHHEEPPAQSNKNKLLNLEKSKLIVVNLTPQPPVHNLNETEEPNHINKSKSAGINMSHDNNLNTSTTDLKEKKLDVEIQTDAEPEDEHVNFKKITQEEPSRKNKLKDFHAQLEDHRLFDNDQTPVSTSHKTRSINTHDNLEPIHHHSALHTEEINEKDVSSKKTIIKENNMNNISMKNGRNDMLNLKSNNYYNDVKTKNSSDNEHDEYPIKVAEKSSKTYRQEDQEHQSNMNFKQVKYASNNDDEIMNKKQSEINKGNFESHATQTSNSNMNKNLLRRDTIAGLPRIPITDSFLNLNELSKTISSVKATEKFYDGSKVWTAAMNIVKNFDKHDGTDKEPIISSDEANDEVEIKDHNHKEPTHVSKKKHLKVKIKLPDERSSQRKPPKRKRSCQKCCFGFFLLIIAFIGIGFIIYFFAWDLIFSSSRPKLHFSN